MVKLKPLEYIFSITNVGKDKLICILGIQIVVPKFNYYEKQCKNLKVQKNKIIFNNFQGELYGCNPKYIVEEILKRKLPYDLYWLCKDIEKIDKSSFPKEIHLTPFKKEEGIKDLSTAKIVVGNVRYNLLIQQGWIKKSSQRYIQTWHGSLGIKKIDEAVSNKNFKDRDWCNIAQVDAKYTDYLLSNSDFEDEVFKTSFWYDGPILKVGHPRNDVFFFEDSKKQLLKDKVYNYFNINKDNKILLYVPSYRDNKRLNCYKLEAIKLKQTLKQKFGGNWVIAIRMHPRLKTLSKKLFNFSNNIIDATNYPDIQELLLVSDICLTDYSSCIFDFMLSRKPGFIFATDIEKYNTERGFYYQLEETPFPIATNNEELINNIELFDYNSYKVKVEEFLTNKGCIEDGLASKRVVDLIEEIMRGEK